MNLRQSTNGFTLIETLVAITFLMLAVVGFLAVSTRGISIGSFAKDEMIAGYLAQDAMEYIRAKKDTNILSGGSWLDGFPLPCINPSPQKCSIDTATEAALPCGGSKCINISYNTDTGLYGYGSGVNWIQTKYMRDFEIIEVAPGREINVTVRVFFPQGSVTKSTVLQANMFNLP
ncbi:hypothetical protein L0Y49_03130 [bacterium]|nr:hypothetical protein [bacterium]